MQTSSPKRLSFGLTCSYLKSGVIKISRTEQHGKNFETRRVYQRTHLIFLRVLSGETVEPRGWKTWRLTVAIKFSSNFIDRKAQPGLSRYAKHAGGATALGRYSSERPTRVRQREARKNSLLQRIDISILACRVTARADQTAGCVEFNALHVGYFAVPLCTTVKVHAGAHACACTHTEIGQSALLYSPHAPRRPSVLLLESFVRSSIRADTSGKKIFPSLTK